MACNHPEAFVSIKNGKRVCGLCGCVAPTPAAAKPAPAQKAAPKKGGKTNARK